MTEQEAWKLLNLQADTLLKLSQTRTEVWKVVVSAMTAGAALIGVGFAIGAALWRHL